MSPGGNLRNIKQLDQQEIINSFNEICLLSVFYMIVNGISLVLGLWMLVLLCPTLLILCVLIVVL